MISTLLRRIALATIVNIAACAEARSQPAAYAYLTFGLQYGDQHISVEAIRLADMAACHAALNALRSAALRPDAVGIWQAPACSETKPIWWADKS